MQRPEFPRLDLMPKEGLLRDSLVSLSLSHLSFLPEWTTQTNIRLRALHASRTVRRAIVMAWEHGNRWINRTVFPGTGFRPLELRCPPSAPAGPGSRIKPFSFSNRRWPRWPQPTGRLPKLPARVFSLARHGAARRVCDAGPAACAIEHWV